MTDRSSSSRRRLVGPELLLLTALAALNAAVPAHSQSSRDYISIVGSSTVYPFSTVVAEQFGRSTNFKTPTVESTGSGGGLKLFCAGVGMQYPDITNSSRRIRESEVRDCATNGIDEIVEVKIGYDGIVLANDKASDNFVLTTEQIYLALAKQVPDPSGAERLVDNPYRRWSDIDSSLPAIDIEVLGPPPTSGTRDAFLELVMEPGCESLPVVASLDRDARDIACLTMREDGRFIEAGENDNLIVQKLQGNPAALGIFGYSFLEQNSDRVKGASIGGVGPDFDSIASGQYPVSRPLYFYVKTAHVDFVPGMREFLEEFIGEAASGEFGYLSDKGLIPLEPAERAMIGQQVRELQRLELEPMDH